MNILILDGSTRQLGNTHKALFYIKGRLKKLGHSLTIIEERVEDCTGCRVCYTDDKFKGSCVIKDAFKATYHNKYDWVIILSPIYFFGLSANAKSMLDRLYYMSKEGLLLSSITFSGSLEKEYSGYDIVWEQLQRACNYCNMTLGHCSNITTFDEILDIREMKEELDYFISSNLEVLHEIKEGCK